MANDTHGSFFWLTTTRCSAVLYGDVLSTQGYHGFAAETVKEAEQFLLGNLPSVIVLDIMMPEVDGIEACQRFRKNPRRTRPDPVFDRRGHHGCRCWPP